MKKSFWDKRIPTLLGLFVILVGTITTTFLANGKQILKINASDDSQPKNIRITNVSDSSFSLSYTTSEKISGSLNYGKNAKLGQSSLDQRDEKNGNLGSYNIHSITVKNLSPSTKYFFTIISGQTSYTTDNKPFEVTTGATLTDTSGTQNSIKGSVLLPDGTAPPESIVYITSQNSQVVSFLVNSGGNYSFPLNNVRSADLSSFHQFGDNDKIKMLVVGQSGESNVTLSISSINQVPTIVISRDYDFSGESENFASPSANLESFPSFESTASAKKSQGVKILSPQKDQEFSDQQPLFKGTGAPNKSVEITIHSDEAIKTTVNTDKNGNWNYRPSTPLSPGEHTITITALDPTGILRTITQSFVVYAEGTQIAQAIGSPTPTQVPTKTPTPTLTLTPTPIASISPTVFLTDTPTPTTFIEQSASASGKVLPPTGNPAILTAGIVGMFISLMGGLLFLLTRKGI